MPSIPDLPGQPVPRYSTEETVLHRLVTQLCELRNDRFAKSTFTFVSAVTNDRRTSYRFPGSQPVTFGSRDLKKLEAKECVAFIRCYPTTEAHSTFQLLGVREN